MAFLSIPRLSFFDTDGKSMPSIPSFIRWFSSATIASTLAGVFGVAFLLWNHDLRRVLERCLEEERDFGSGNRKNYRRTRNTSKDNATANLQHGPESSSPCTQCARLEREKEAVEAAVKDLKERSKNKSESLVGNGKTREQLEDDVGESKDVHQEPLRAAEAQASAQPRPHTEEPFPLPTVETALLEDEIHSKAAQIDELKSELATLSSNYDAANQLFVSELESARICLALQSASISSLRQNLHDVLAEVGIESRVVGNLEDAVAQLKESESSERTELALLMKDEATSSRLAAELESIQHEIARQSGLVTSLRESFQKALSDFRVKAKVASDLEKELGELKKNKASHDLVSSRVEIESQATLISSLRQDLESALSELESKSQIASDLEKEVVRFRKEKEFNCPLVYDLEVSHR